MAYGDTQYGLLASGSTATSANPPELLFGAYTGLSLVGNDEVVHVQIQASVNNFEMLVDNQMNTGINFVASDFYIDLPPMRAGNASQLHAMNRDAGNNAVIWWAIWRR